MTDVTLLMTVYNGMPYLRQAIQSILDQTLEDWRCVIIDDGSTDGSGECLDALGDERFTIIHQANAGTAAAANRGLAYCDTRYTARMDADDISLPERLARQVAFLDAHPDVGLVGAQMAPLGEAGAGGSLKLPTEHAAIMSALASGRHGLGHSCITFRTELARQIGGYWSLRLVDDWDFMLRMGEAAMLANLDEVLHLYRVHGTSLNGAALRRMRFSIDYACELARRRRAGLTAISPEQFEAQRAGRPWWARLRESVDLHARGQYRVALAELHGGQRLRGRARLAYAALCSPRLAAERAARMVFPSRRARA
jgi:glycosyltransferase involved in cell wall biosynthesis